MLIVINGNKKLQYDNRFKDDFDMSKTPYIYVDDESELAKKILSAHDYTVSVDVNGKLKDIVVTKTKAQWQAEQPIEKTSKEIAKENLTKAATINEKLEIVLEYLNLN
jgi:hypothetical protein